MPPFPVRSVGSVPAPCCVARHSPAIVRLSLWLAPGPLRLASRHPWVSVSRRAFPRRVLPAVFPRLSTTDSPGVFSPGGFLLRGADAARPSGVPGTRAPIQKEYNIKIEDATIVANPRTQCNSFASKPHPRREKCTKKRPSRCHKREARLRFTPFPSFLTLSAPFSSAPCCRAGTDAAASPVRFRDCPRPFTPRRPSAGGPARRRGRCRAG